MAPEPTHTGGMPILGFADSLNTRRRTGEELWLNTSGCGAIVTAVSLPPMLSHRMASGVSLGALRHKRET
ncbi:hypothetical protein N7462_009676 [Penicillium macrosclerotiorum]|uniref:uncharacterized protein n=1 Tax=Penicillium macrosclerotiorum TaxID=303699 RepID=UPI0025494724|nr:uncharacterized protein N7462_009676 [Penicillium macrosclerotiorum]KAJ5674237.1 hypothetical protein N7462_009676 [Penicillium macrosclerotiorum]